MTDIAFDAGFEALESFRRFATPSFYLPSANGIHYQPPNQKGELHIDLLDHLLAHERWLMTHMFVGAKALTDQQLDLKLEHFQPLHFENPQHTLRDMFHPHIF